MLVEMLVKISEPQNENGTQSGDIIIIQPSGFEWGRGDLMGKTIFTLDLALPCTSGGSDLCNRCTQCSYTGIIWKDEALIPGVSIAKSDIYCPKQKHGAAFCEYLFELGPKGEPLATRTKITKNPSKLDISSLLTAETIENIKVENQLLDPVERDLRLFLGRKESNQITENDIIYKETA